MIAPKDLYEQLEKSGCNFYAGVPDSLLKEFLSYVQQTSDNHVITANEGSAVALAAGHYIATGDVPVVYLQNSGIGNTVNPLVSLCSDEVYSIPMVVIVGWRGEPGVKDEPQHIKQGRVTPTLLESIGIPFETLDSKSDSVSTVQSLVNKSKVTRAPVVLLVKKKTFSSAEKTEENTNDGIPKREGAICEVTRCIDELGDSLIVSTTGMISRELYTYRFNNDKEGWDFYNVGSMGHASQIALGIARNKKQTRTFCFDGDGAAIMHLGGMTTIGQLGLNNFFHIIFDNEAHDSVGGQPTASTSVNFTALAKACGYKFAEELKTLDDIGQQIVRMTQAKGPALLVIKVQKGSRKDLMRPNLTPKENLSRFVERCQSLK